MSDWSSDVCSSDQSLRWPRIHRSLPRRTCAIADTGADIQLASGAGRRRRQVRARSLDILEQGWRRLGHARWQAVHQLPRAARQRSEEHTSELQSLMRISYAVFSLKTKRKTQI